MNDLVDVASCGAEINDILKKIFGIPMENEKLNEAEDSYRYFMKKNFGIDESEESDIEWIYKT